jgi:hypothetical protein
MSLNCIPEARALHLRLEKPHEKRAAQLLDTEPTGLRREAPNGAAKRRSTMQIDCVTVARGFGRHIAAHSSFTTGQGKSRRQSNRHNSELRLILPSLLSF